MSDSFSSISENSNKDDKIGSKANSEKKSKKQNSRSVHSFKLNNNSKENREYLLKLENDLKNRDDIDKFKLDLNMVNEENQNILQLYENEDKITQELKEKNNCYKLDDDLFEERAIRILSDFYGLKEYILYPYFNIGISEKKKTNVIKIYYYIIDFLINDGNETKNEIGQKDEKNRKEVEQNKDNETNLKNDINNKRDKKIENKNESYVTAFLNDRKTYLASFKGIPMMFQRENGVLSSVDVLSKNYNSSIEFKFEKIGNEYITSFPFAKISDDLIEASNNVKETKNNIDSIVDKTKKGEEEKNKLKEKLKIYEKVYGILEENYSEENIRFLLKNKMNKLILLEEKSKLIDENNFEAKNNSEKEINKLKDEIKEQQKLLDKITIKIVKKDQEFDGLFFSSKEITIQNTIGDTLNILAKKPIIVEVKNHSNYNTIVDNLRIKKRLLDELGLNEKQFYFIGILRGIEVNKEEKENINKKYYPNLNFDNMIIIYPDKYNFLGEILYMLKNETVEKKHEEKKGENQAISALDAKMEQLIKEVRSLKNDMIEVKKKLNIK